MHILIMDQADKNLINRKKFLQMSSSGIVGLGLVGCSPVSILKKPTTKVTLHYRTLGRTGLKVSFVGHGASRVEVPGVVKHGIDHGINFIDT